MTVGLVVAARNARLNALRDLIDAGASAGVLRIYDGTRPATGGAVTTLLAHLTTSNPCAPDAASGILTFSSITADSSANATGTATWARFFDSDLNAVFDCSVGTAGSDVNLNTVTITLGAIVSATSALLTEGNA